MFRGLISDAKAAAGAVIVKYVARASVAVPFLIAGGFATAALTVLLVDRYGAQTAYWLLAAGFTLFGMTAALVVTVKEQEEEVAMQAPLALLSALLASPMGPNSAFGIAKLLGRNLPLVLLLVIGGFLLWPRDPAADGADVAAAGPLADDAPVPKPNGVYTERDEARV